MKLQISSLELILNLPQRIEGSLAIMGLKNIIDFLASLISVNRDTFWRLKGVKFECLVNWKAFDRQKVWKFHARKLAKVVRWKLKMALTRKIFAAAELFRKKNFKASNEGRTGTKSMKTISARTFDDF